ncbi:MAG: hypothetical protein IKE33_02065, partial [Erysipelotrichaceae bacterium]|nr:hypothetical protein [Erysipelotrichaceae bacterium]
EVDDYNRKNGRLTTDDAKDTILNDIRSSGVDASGIDTTLLVEDNKVTSLSEELEKIDAVTQEIHESLTRNVEQRSFDDVRFVEQVDEPVTEKEAEPVIEESVVEPVVEPVEEATVVEEPEPVKAVEETVAEPVKEEVLATPAPEAIEEDTIRLSFDTTTAPVEESPVETETKPQEAETTIMLDPMKMKAADNKPSAEDYIEETASQQINNTILTIQSMVQNQEEEKEEEDDEVDEYRPNKILNMILIVLIIALIGVLGVIGYWILLARGII